MSLIEVVMPQMGESIAEGTIVKWHKKVGDTVRKDETLLEISTDKVDSEIPAPASGVLTKIVVEEQKTVPVRTVIAYLETAGAGAAAVPQAPAKAPEEPPAPRPSAPAAPQARPAPQPAGNRFYSPLVLNIARTEAVSMEELEGIPGTGDGGRVSKKDILNFVLARKSGKTAPAAAPSAPAPALPVGSEAVHLQQVDSADLRAKYPSPGHEILQMTNVMQKMAAHMLESVRTSPQCSAVHEVDMTAVVKHREAQAAAFERKEGFRLTFSPYIAGAVVRAIKRHPLVNSSIDGDKIIRKTFINLGIAVAADNGLIVPVIKHAEEKNFLGLARAVNDLVTRTRSKKLTPEEIQGGTFTISNFGVFGTVIGTPIISQPQIAILGTGAVKKRPVVIDDAIAIRSMALFSLTFDHRIIDGALAGAFLNDIVQGLEGFDTTMKF